MSVCRADVSTPGTGDTRVSWSDYYNLQGSSKIVEIIYHYSTTSCLASGHNKISIYGRARNKRCRILAPSILVCRDLQANCCGVSGSWVTVPCWLLPIVPVVGKFPWVLRAFVDLVDVQANVSGVESISSASRRGASCQSHSTSYTGTNLYVARCGESIEEE